MENEIKLGEWVRTDNGIIGKYVKYRGIEDTIETNNKWIDFDIEKDIVKHSHNLIDLIQCGDYVNGKEVIMDLQKSKEWYKSKDNFITCKDYTFEENEIETIVTKEMMESITYKVTKM